MIKIIHAIILILISFTPFLVTAENGKFTVVIDAGHGGHDTGAVDNDVKEKDINLGVALKLQSLLNKKMKDVKVVMTRDDDTFISLQGRADIANKAKGNLFVSIHTNSVDKSNPNRKTVQGTSVYALGLHKDQDNMKVARRENSVIELESDYHQKYSGFDPSKDESYIIFEMAQKKNLGQSLKFANLSQNQLVDVAGRKNRGVKQAGFWVLWATSMPAVLVELDFICNPESAKFMGSKSGQEKMAEALFSAIKKYVEGQNHVSAITENDGSSSTPDISETPSVKNIKRSSSGAVALVARQDVAKEQKSPVSKNSGSTVVRRRRRVSPSNNGKNAVETTEINLHSEKETLPEEVENEMDSSEPVVSDDENPTVKDEKDKKKKGKKKKKQKEDGKKSNSKSRRILVDKDGQAVAMQDIDENGKVEADTRDSTGNKSRKTKKQKIKTVYKIQILVSEENLKQNNPRFCGLKPISSFKVNNMYKYTYGESESKEEIQKLLVEVRKKIPDAFIITTSK